MTLEHLRKTDAQIYELVRAEERYPAYGGQAGSGVVRLRASSFDRLRMILREPQDERRRVGQLSLEGVTLRREAALRAVRPPFPVRAVLRDGAEAIMAGLKKEG